MPDKFKEECGVFGAFDLNDASYLTYQGLYALQHRGQESAGIASYDGNQINIYRNMGLVSEVFAKFNFETLPGKLAIGHNRYSTTGNTTLTNAQPLRMECRQGVMAVAHNGNISNAHVLRENFIKQGSIFQTTSDSEIFVHLVSKSGHEQFEDAIPYALSKIEGAYSFLILVPGKLIAARDPLGFRPLALGKLNGGYCLASETCAFDLLGAEYIRDVEPGEILTISDEGMKSVFLEKPKHTAHCIFEFIYFSRPDSLIFGEKCDKIRREFGRQLARDDELKNADIVISVPDSSNTAALGYSEESGIKFEIGLIRNHYIGRTFISPKQKDRDKSVRIKFNPVKGAIENKRVVLVEDSIVRGTTLKALLAVLRDAGAKEIHVRVASPPVVSPCYFGIDLSTKKELIGAGKSVDEICQYIGADSLKYLSIEGMFKVTPKSESEYCKGCFSGVYPVTTPDNYSKERMS